APDAMDLSRIQSRLQELKEEADGVEVKLQEFPFSVPLDTQKRALQRQISDLEDLQRRAQAAGQSGGASGAGLAGAIGLNASTSRKQLDELFASVKTA
ncbi:hypothetical protein, partial [Citrobacter braakii]|uniref:hypothetical protein n=1 Tax=Citrobacter braakii TaxID=57706 RepID=UPI00197D7F10